ncbi:MAG: hypothetical protein WC935_00110 [Thermoleophilia bacterium]
MEEERPNLRPRLNKALRENAELRKRLEWLDSNCGFYVREGGELLLAGIEYRWFPKRHKTLNEAIDAELLVATADLKPEQDA